MSVNDLYVTINEQNQMLKEKDERIMELEGTLTMSKQLTQQWMRKAQDTETKLQKVIQLIKEA
jgi:hypothetical protein